MGKSTVLGLFKKNGALTINADSLVHDILKKPAIIRKLSRLLGKEILTAGSTRLSINKKCMANIIFSDPEKRKRAEKIIHPEVIKAAEKIRKETASKNRNALIVFEVPLLFEAGYDRIFDKIIVVWSDKAETIKRLERTGLTKKQIRDRMRAQTSISKKKAHADFLIDNRSGIKDLKAQVKALTTTLNNQ